MRGFNHATILSPSFHGLHKERLAQWPAFCDPKNGPKIPGGGTSRKIGWGVQHASWNPYPISDLIKNLIPHFRPEALEPGAWPDRMTSCHGTYTVVGVNIKREMDLSPNDEEVANSSKKHAKFKTRRHKPYTVSDQNGRNWYPILTRASFKQWWISACYVTPNPWKFSMRMVMQPLTRFLAI